MDGSLAEFGSATENVQLEENAEGHEIATAFLDQ
jgi:hypothetical protein